MGGNYLNMYCKNVDISCSSNYYQPILQVKFNNVPLQAQKKDIKSFKEHLQV